MSLLTFFELPLYYGKVTTSWFLELGFWLNTFLTAISECPETETVANTLWLVTNSKSCPNCKWVVCLYIIIIIIVFSLPECQWISSHVVWHKNIVTTTNFKLCCVTHTVTACKLKTLLCDTKLKNIQTANDSNHFMRHRNSDSWWFKPCYVTQKYTKLYVAANELLLFSLTKLASSLHMYQHPVSVWIWTPLFPLYSSSPSFPRPSYPASSFQGPKLFSTTFGPTIKYKQCSILHCRTETLF